MASQKKPSPFITLSNGRTYRVRELRLSRYDPNPDVRYLCHLECSPFREPRGSFDFDIYLHHALFRSLPDQERRVAIYSMKEARRWLEAYCSRERLSTGTVEIHCDGRPAEVFIP